MNGIIKLHFGNCMTTDKTLRLYNTTSEVALCYCRKTWIINNRMSKIWKKQKRDF